MSGESRVGIRNQSPIKPILAATRLVAGHQQYGLPRRIKRKRGSPHAVISIEAKLLHVGMLRTLERIHAWASSLRSELFQNFRLRKQFDSYRLAERSEFQFKLHREADHPSHLILCIAVHMVSTPYKSEIALRQTWATKSCTTISAKYKAVNNQSLKSNKNSYVKSYHASKWGIEGFMDSVMQEVTPFNIGVKIVEPGGARTQFRFGGAKVGAKMAAYGGTPAGIVHAILQDTSRLLIGDPRKMVEIMIDSVEQNPAPKRIALGSDSYAVIRKALTERRAALEAQKDLAFSTDFPK